MSACGECGREFAATEEQWLNSHDRDGYPNGPLCGVAVDMGPSECRIHTIKRLKARVAQLEADVARLSSRSGFET